MTAAIFSEAARPHDQFRAASATFGAACHNSTLREGAHPLEQVQAGQKETVLWNSWFVRIFIYASLSQFTMSVSNIVLPLYVINSLGYSNAQSGLLGTAFTIACIVCRFFTGGLSDKFGRRAMLILGAFIVGIALFSMGFATAFFLILILKALQGIGHSLNTTASTAAASDVLPRSRVGEGIAYYGLHASIVGAIGPTISLALMSVGVASGDSNYRLPLLWAGFAGFAATAIALSLNYEKKRRLEDGQEPKQTIERKEFRVNDFIEKRALLPALLQLFQSFAMGASVFMIVFASSMEFTSISLYYVIIAVVTMGTRFLLGKKMDTMRPVIAVIIPLILTIFSYALMAYSMSETAFLINGFITGIYGAILMPTFNSMALKMVPEGNRGAASATYWLGFDVGIALGMIAFGALIDAGGFAIAFYATAGYLTLYGVGSFFMLKKTQPIRDIEAPTE